jgi:hypothetical protein
MSIQKSKAPSANARVSETNEEEEVVIIPEENDEDGFETDNDFSAFQMDFYGQEMAISDATEEIAEGISALSQLSSLEESVEKIMEIEDDGMARTILDAVLASSDYEALRPSFEGTDIVPYKAPGSKEESKSVLKKIYETTKAIVMAIIKAVKDFVKSIFDKNYALSESIIKFNNKVKGLKGKTKEDKIQTGQITGILFVDKLFIPDRFNASVADFVIGSCDLVKDMVLFDKKKPTGTEAEKFYAKHELTMGAYEELAKKKKSENILYADYFFVYPKVQNMVALEAWQIVKMADTFAKDMPGMKKAQKNAESVLQSYEKDAIEIELDGLVNDTKAEMKIVKDGANLLSLVLKGILSDAYKLNVAKLSLLVDNAKNIEQA